MLCTVSLSGVQEIALLVVIAARIASTIYLMQRGRSSYPCISVNLRLYDHFTHSAGDRTQGMATHPQSNGGQSEGARPRKDTKVAVEDSETWVDAKRYTVYKVRYSCNLLSDIRTNSSSSVCPVTTESST